MATGVPAESDRIGVLVISNEDRSVYVALTANVSEGLDPQGNRRPCSTVPAIMRRCLKCGNRENTWGCNFALRKRTPNRLTHPRNQQPPHCSQPLLPGTAASRPWDYSLQMRFMRRKSFMLKAAANLRMLRDIGGQDLRATKRGSFIDDTHTTPSFSTMRY
jgi:hypothetical protein